MEAGYESVKKAIRKETAVKAECAGDERAFRAALACLPQMSPLALPRLIRLAGSAEELWRMLRAGEERATALVGGEKAGVWKDASRRTDPVSLLEGLGKRGIRVIVPGEEILPEILWSIYDPPAVLFARGMEMPAASVCIAVVGARKASAYGRRCAEFLAGELARRGVVVVSGAAYGIDAHAHRGCLQAGGYTVAVLGCGIDRAYPPEHAGLLERIMENGCLLSEYPPGEDPLPWRFPHRNRIIAGLSRAVVVVEASEKSGALITAEFALEEGREVMAVPGPIDHPLTRGTHALIQKGAKLVTGVEDILEELPWTPGWALSIREARGSSHVHMPSGEISPRERELLQLLEDGAKSLDAIAMLTGEMPHRLLVTLTTMSLKGWVHEEPGGKYSLSPFRTGTTPSSDQTMINNNNIF